MYLLQGTTVIGPESAISAVTTDPTIKNNLAIQSWVAGNILLYSVNDKLTYIIPYYSIQPNLNVPVMVAAVDGQTKQVGFYQIRNPNNATEVQNAANSAVEKLGITPPPPSPPATNVTGTVVGQIQSYTKYGNTQWIININNGTATVRVYASADKLSQSDIDKIFYQLGPGSTISVEIDSNNNVIRIIQP